MIYKQYYSHWGLDIINSYVEQIEQNDILKSVIYQDSKTGNNLFIHAKKYINKNKISFIVPFLINSGNLFLKNNLNEKLRWILINTIKNSFIFSQIAIIGLINTFK
ncbi:MAG: hypothetical protein ACTSPY_09635 [Candidatus Helarchaeota archaeon]